MKYRFVLSGETPSKKNSRRTLPGGRTIPSKGFMEWHAAHTAELMAQRRPSVPLDHGLCVKMTFHHADLRRRDSDNQATSVLDLLKDTGIISDDNWLVVRKIVCRNVRDTSGSRCVVIIENIPD